MSIGPAQPRDGDYIVTRGQDTETERRDAARVLYENGCRAVRFDPQADGRLIAHGYLRGEVS